MREVTVKLVKTLLTLIVLGFIITSKEMITVAVIPLTFLLIPSKVSVRGVNVRRSEIEYVGETMDVEITVEFIGFGIVKVMHTLPNTFELVGGNNAITSFVFGKRDVKVSYRVRVLRRGSYSLNELLVECEHPFLISKSFFKLQIEFDVEVKQKLRRVVRVETIRTKAKSPIPDIDISKIGSPGTDFKEIKEYTQGDPVKFINWKASAKTGKLMVNRYEVEGKKTVWIFVDANEYMTYGESVKNHLEYAIELSSALAYYFLSRGHKVGCYVIGSGINIYPDVGKRQFRRIFEELARVEYGSEDLISALQNVKKSLLIYKPFVFLITRVEYSKPFRFTSELMKMGLKGQIITLRDEVKGDELDKAVFELVRTRMRRKIRALDVDINKPIYSVVSRFVR